MESKMFCYQCQETAKGSGCTIAGVCGKRSTTAGKMDLLLFIVRGISVVSTALRNSRVVVRDEINAFVTDALFSTITNVNFDEAELQKRIQEGIELRENLKGIAEKFDVELPNVDEVSWKSNPLHFSKKSEEVGVLRTENEDVRSLKELIVYGLKGMAAYLEHARHLGFTSEQLDAFIQGALSSITVERLSVDDLLGLVLETGAHGLQAMALLDNAHTSVFGNPEVTVVNTSVGSRPGILVTGHDMHDLQMLLQQSANSGVDIYTHGEMLPAHYYPLLKQYTHLVGNYGGAWWQQRDDFTYFNGPILVTTNCLIPPSDVSLYKRRIFTTNSVGYPGCMHIYADCKGHKDFSKIIELAKNCAAPDERVRRTIVGGFAHHQVKQLAEKIVEALRRGKIKKFIVMAGCDGRMPSRAYYTDFAAQLPEDCVILTAGCAKYRYNNLELGSIDGIPRIWDAGQCNDSYSLILIATMLRDLLGYRDINQLPIVFNIAWYEQKAVLVLLALLSLNIKNIHLGPTLPAFLSSNVLRILSENFGIQGISKAEDDIEKLVA